MVEPRTLSVHPTNNHALPKAQLPTTKTELRSVLGICTVYRRLVKGFAGV